MTGTVVDMNVEVIDGMRHLLSCGMMILWDDCTKSEFTSKELLIRLPTKEQAASLDE